MISMTISMIKRAALLLMVAVFAAGCTADRTNGWTDEAREITIEDTQAANPTVAMNSAGLAYVSYTSRAGGQVDAYLVRISWDGDVGDPVRVNHVPGEVAIHNQAPAQVVAGPDGTIYVAWVRQTQVEGRRFPASEVRLARSLDGGATFDDAVTVAEGVDFPTSRHFHNVAVGLDGTIYVSWLDSEARDRSAINGAAINSSAVGATASHFHEHAHGGSEADLPGTQLKVARSTDRGATFEPAVVVANRTCQCCRTALTAGEDGTIYVAWRHIFGANTRDMAVASSTDGGRTFSPPVRVHSDGWHIEACPHSGPSLVVDAAARLHVAWYTGAEGREGLYYTISGDAGRTFEAAIPLRSGLPVTQARLAAAGRSAIAAYDDPRRSEIALLDLSRADAISEAFTVAGSAAALDAADGRAALAWKDEQGIQVRMFRLNR